MEQDRARADDEEPPQAALAHSGDGAELVLTANVSAKGPSAMWAVPVPREQDCLTPDAGTLNMHYLHALAEPLWWMRQEWAMIKGAIESSIPFSPKALHPIVGVIVQLVSAALFRSSIAKPGPWLAVLALELANEWTDLTVDVWPGRYRSLQIAGSLWDLLLTMLLPTVLLLVARWYPRVLRG